MNNLAIADAAEFYRVDASLRLDPEKRAMLGQYMTPTPIARFMASLFEDVSADIRLLDPGAGVGSLTAAFIERLCDGVRKPKAVELVAYEIEPLLTEYLRATLASALMQCQAAQIRAECEFMNKISY